MKILKWIIWILYPVFLVALFASLLTTRPYILFSEGQYATHDGEGTTPQGETYEFDHTYVSTQLIDYLNYRQDDLYFGAYPEDDEPVMRDIEIRHMEDVRDVYTLVRGAGLFALLGVLIGGAVLYLNNRRAFYETLRDAFYLPMFFILFVGGWFLIDFSAAFTVFHELFFDNDDWILRSGDVLIRILPQMFWLISGMIILALLTGTIIVTSWAGRTLLKRHAIEGGTHDE